MACEVPCILVLFFMFALFVVTSEGQGKGIGAKNVNEILQHNPCFCSCKPMERKYFYIPIRQTSSWFGAVAYCQSSGMEIAEVWNENDAKELEELLKEEVSDLNPEFFWIGANDIGQQGRQMWGLSGRPVTYSNWSAGEPNNGQDEEDQDQIEHCAAVLSDTLQWNDFRCSANKKFICQYFRDN